MRGTSADNPFDLRNERPTDYLIADKILEKPGRISNLNSMKD